MSEEKLYVVEDDNRLHLAFNDAGKPMWFQTGGNFTATDSVASMWSLKHGGHVVTLVEEPKKVVLSKEEAKIVEDAHNDKYPACYISRSTDGERFLMEAFVNGYTVAKEKKYLVYKVLGGKQKNKQVAQAYRSSVYPGTVSWFLINEVTNKPNDPSDQFTEAEIEQYGLQDCEKEEVTEDAD
ncbi:DUF1642 domain-containing protein [Lacticaseibacillus paracasei]|nr:DUF1642 domain-containing protein [Lacticaseibacillus paracasei]